MIDTYLQYGISSDLAQKLAGLGLPKTTFEKTSKKNLKEKYGLSDNEVNIVNDLIQRKPINKDTVEELLYNSNYTCCICKGTKGSSYIIHHIKEYSISQDNSYFNLAVLCLNDHDLAHKKGKTLSLQLTESDIHKAKQKWEKQVYEQNLEKACRNGNITEIDFLNIPRILELCVELFGNVPHTQYSNELYSNHLILKSGALNDCRIREMNKNPETPLIFFAPNGSSILKHHYYEIFKALLNHLNFVDLDHLLNRKSLKKGIVGQYCYYIGGLYSKRLPDPITESSEFMKFYFKRKPFVVEWLVDPKYFCSSSAKWRTLHRGVYIIFGKIRNVNIESIEGKDQIIVDIRPYCFGLPKEQKDRTPSIAYREQFDDFFDEEDN
ncbi:HNH endonuclease signature motif containing protein [Niabella drilacis]|uniref:HNH endonuclease n=1 Tax=Niabella drilacis (strain DSM 25811 / CCM 8410 / CCUG 62505 / LMG 26954 / E90) TaxID=1285928 RepID=A0A1G6WFP4_NIADE|nr:HNH endonuclease signature motif containing protein [Niabella drilacis]SDD63886.1 hypothetical protein SAMN04487894_11190 [Niabella drilacis]